MEDRRKYEVGTDNDTSDTMRKSMARLTAMHLAQVYKRTIWPRVLELTFEVDGVVVEVRVVDKAERRKDKE